MTKKDFKIEGAERFWLGPDNEEDYVVYRCQSRDSELKWSMTPDGTVLDPGYSEFSVRLFNRDAVSLSFINTTIAILPKSKLRKIHALIGEYLKEVDSANKE